MDPLFIYYLVNQHPSDFILNQWCSTQALGLWVKVGGREGGRLKPKRKGREGDREWENTERERREREKERRSVVRWSEKAWKEERGFLSREEEGRGRERRMRRGKRAGECVSAFEPSKHVTKRYRLQHTDVLVSTTTTANMGAVVGTLTMQTKQRRPSRGEGIHTQTQTRAHASNTHTQTCVSLLNTCMHTYWQWNFQQCIFIVSSTHTHTHSHSSTNIQHTYASWRWKINNCWHFS